MEEFGTKWRKSIFGRMLITFILVVLPLYILGAFIYNRAIYTVREEISNTMLSQVEFYLDSLESEITRMKWLQFDCVNDENLRQLATIPESLDAYDKTKAVSRLQQRLVAIANSSDYITNVKAYIPAIGSTVTTRLGGFDTFIDPDEFSALDMRAYAYDAQIIYWQDRLFLSINYPPPGTLQKNEPAGSMRQPLFIVGIELSIHRLKEALKQFNSYKEGGSLLVGSFYDFVYASGSNNKVNDRIEAMLRQTVKTSPRGTVTVTAGDKRYLVTYSRSEYLGMTLARYVPESEVFSRLKEYYIWMWFFTLLALILIAIYSFFIHRLIQKPLRKLIKSFRKLEKGDLSISIKHTHDDEFTCLYSSFKEMVEKLKTLIDQVYKQRILAQNAQLKQLQSQINPHFLYNSYFILHRMVTLEDNENAARFSQQLGTYLKFITRCAADEVPLSKEVEHARIYTEIQAMRFVSRMKVTFAELPEEFRDIYVPRLILQPIIENAFEHGLENKAQDGTLAITFQSTDTGLCVLVEDNGGGMSIEEIEALNKTLNDSCKSDAVENTGIINIHKRLQFRFGNDSGLFFSRSELGGLKAAVSISFRKGH